MVKYAGDFDNETLTELFKGRVVTPTVRNDVTVKENVIQSKEPAIKLLRSSEGIADKTDRNDSKFQPLVFPVFFHIQTISTIAIIMKDMAETTTIQITKQTRDQLRAIGSMGDDYNTVIEKLIIEHNRNRLAEYGQKVVKENKEKFVSIDEL